MKRTTTALSAFAAGAALLLAGCGSDTAGTPATQAPATAQVSSTSSADASSTSEDSSTVESTSEDTSTADSSTEESTSEDTSTEESTSEDTSTADTSATTTIGGGGGDLDETSVTWFNTYCSGVSPALTEVKKLSTVMGSGSSSDPQATLKKLAPIFTAMGSAFTKTAKDLDGVPAPTFDGGDTLATTTVKAMNEFGPKFTEIGTALQKGDTSALTKLGSDVQGLQELSKFKVDAGTLAAIKKVPSCEPLFSMGS